MDNTNTPMKTTWNGGKSGGGKLQALGLETNIAIPVALGGTGSGADPKSLLVGAAAACYTMTLASLLEAKNLPIIELTVDSVVLDGKEIQLQIEHSIHAHLADGATEGQINIANSLFGTADRACAVGNMLKAAGWQIVVRGEVASES